jgi:hypothetical protein
MMMIVKAKHRDQIQQYLALKCKIHNLKALYIKEGQAGLKYLANLIGMGLRQRSTESCKILVGAILSMMLRDISSKILNLAENVHRSAINGTVTRNDTVARNLKM